MDSIDTVIEKCKVDIEEDNEEKFDMKVKNHCSGQNIPKPHRPEKVGRSATRPRAKLAELLAQETCVIESNDVVNEKPFKLHRPEKVGRPATRPRVKLADLLAEENNNTTSGEIDTGPPVGNEVW